MKHMDYLFVSQEEVDNYCMQIFADIQESKFKPDVILGLLWGGVVPTRYFIDMFDVSRHNCKVTFASLYSGINERKDDVQVAHLFDESLLIGKNVLIIDDIWDTGKTMKAVLESIQGKAQGVRTATLFYRVNGEPDISNAPSFYGKKIVDEWVVFPWEKYEFWRQINVNKEKS